MHRFHEGLSGSMETISYRNLNSDWLAFRGGAGLVDTSYRGDGHSALGVVSSGAENYKSLNAPPCLHDVNTVRHTGHAAASHRER